MTAMYLKGQYFKGEV